MTNVVDAAVQDRPTGTYSGAVGACQRLGSDVATALGYPPIPDSVAQGDFLAGLNHYQNAANYCVNGIYQLDWTLIDEAITETEDGSNALQAASALVLGSD